MSPHLQDLWPPKLREESPPTILYDTLITCILAPDIGHCLAKNRVMSNESCFTTDKVVRSEFNFLDKLLTS